MQEKILFVILPYCRCDDSYIDTHRMVMYPAFPYGVLSIATYIKNNSNVEVKIFDNNLQNDLGKTIQTFKPTTIAISIMFDFTYKYIKEIIGEIRSVDKSCKIVMGGIVTKFLYQKILSEFPDIIAVCYCDGEIPMLQIAKNPNDFSCEAWVTRKKLSEGFVPKKTVIQNLDELINIDYNLVNPDNYPMTEGFSPNAQKFKIKKQFYVVTSRGCPFSCTFCMHSNDEDKSVRFASVPAIIDHVKYLKEHYGMNVLTFYDDQILLDKKRAKDLFRQLAQFDLRIEMPNGVTVAFMDDELVELMSKAGVDSLCLAIESGSPHVIKLMKKPIHIEQVKPIVESLHKHGIVALGFFVNGLPGETDQDLAITTQFIKDVGLDWACIGNATPIRGTELYQICEDNNYIPKNIPLGEINMKKYIINTPNQTPIELETKSYKMNLDVNFVNNRAMVRGDYKTALKMFMGVLDRDPSHAFAYYYASKCAEALYYKYNNLEDWKKYSKELIHEQ